MKFFSLVAAIVLFTSLFFWVSNLPQDAGTDVPEGKLNSLSYAPFREDQGPIIGVFPTADHIETDLKLLSKKTRSIRTYASAEGTMPVIPRLARKYGLTLTQGAWLGVLDKSNQIEIDKLIRSAKRNSDVVKRVIVGNEVLLRGDLEPEQLLDYIRAVKNAIQQPVSYADVWSMYMQHPELIEEVDYLTIHILPYWEDEPIAVDEAAAHIERIYRKVREEADRIAPGKAILIGEAGWPSAGRQRGFAIPSVVNEARFIRGLIQVANASGFDYNIVEAIDQPWKSKLEGVVGANWGLLTTDRKEVFPLTGNVYENPDWYQGLAVSALLFVIACVLFYQPLQALPSLHALVFLLAMQLLLAVWVGQLEFSWSTCYTMWQRLFAAAAAAAAAALGGLMLWRGFKSLRGESAPPTTLAVSHRLYLAFCIYALYETLNLAVNGRYISFPYWDTCVPVVGVLVSLLPAALRQGQWRQALAVVNGQTADPNRWLTMNPVLGHGLLISAVALLIGETYAFVISRDMAADYPDFATRLEFAVRFTIGNRQLLTWLASLSVLSLPLLVGYKPTNI